MNKNTQTTENEIFSKHYVYSHRGARGIGLQPLHLWSSKPQAPAGELRRPSHQTDPHPAGERRRAWERAQDLGAGGEAAIACAEASAGGASVTLPADPAASPARCRSHLWALTALTAPADRTRGSALPLAGWTRSTASSPFTWRCRASLPGAWCWARGLCGEGATEGKTGLPRPRFFGKGKIKVHKCFVARDDHKRWSKSERERQTPYDIAYVWNPKQDADELI